MNRSHEVDCWESCWSKAATLGWLVKVWTDFRDQIRRQVLWTPVHRFSGGVHRHSPFTTGYQFNTNLEPKYQYNDGYFYECLADNCAINKHRSRQRNGLCEQKVGKRLTVAHQIIFFFFKPLCTSNGLSLNMNLCEFFLLLVFQFLPRFRSLL
jgi:hypothetical protein